MTSEKCLDYTVPLAMSSHGLSARIINVALKMLKDESFDVERLIRKKKPLAFGIDLHWLPHAQGSLEVAKLCKRYHPDTAVIFGGYSATYFHEELIHYPEVDFINVIAPGVSKGGALEALASFLRVPLTEVVAIGETDDITGKYNAVLVEKEKTMPEMPRFGMKMEGGRAPIQPLP